MSQAEMGCCYSVLNIAVAAKQFPGEAATAISSSLQQLPIIHLLTLLNPFTAHLLTSRGHHNSRTVTGELSLSCARPVADG